MRNRTNMIIAVLAVAAVMLAGVTASGQTTTPSTEASTTATTNPVTSRTPNAHTVTVDCDQLDGNYGDGEYRFTTTPSARFMPYLANTLTYTATLEVITAPSASYRPNEIRIHPALRPHRDHHYQTSYGEVSGATISTSTRTAIPRDTTVADGTEIALPSITITRSASQSFGGLVDMQLTIDVYQDSGNPCRLSLTVDVGIEHDSWRSETAVLVNPDQIVYQQWNYTSGKVLTKVATGDTFTRNMTWSEWLAGDWNRVDWRYSYHHAKNLVEVATNSG